MGKLTTVLEQFQQQTTSLGPIVHDGKKCHVVWSQPRRSEPIKNSGRCYLQCGVNWHHSLLHYRQCVPS